MKKTAVLILLMLAITTACTSTKNPTDTATPETLVYKSRYKFLYLAEKTDVFQRGCGIPEGEAYHQPRPLVRGEIPSCYVGVTEISGTYSRADIDAILAFMATVKEGDISYINVPAEISTQFYNEEIDELPTNIAEVFYGPVGGSLYLIEKINEEWQVIDKGWWIR